MQAYIQRRRHTWPPCSIPLVDTNDRLADPTPSAACYCLQPACQGCDPCERELKVCWSAASSPTLHTCLCMECGSVMSKACPSCSPVAPFKIPAPLDHLTLLPARIAIPHQSLVPVYCIYIEDYSHPTLWFFVRLSLLSISSCLPVPVLTIILRLFACLPSLDLPVLTACLPACRLSAINLSSFWVKTPFIISPVSQMCVLALSFLDPKSHFTSWTNKEGTLKVEIRWYIDSKDRKSFQYWFCNTGDSWHFLHTFLFCVTMGKNPNKNVLSNANNGNGKKNLSFIFMNSLTVETQTFCRMLTL